MPELSVIVPAYRERDDIPLLLDALEKALAGLAVACMVCGMEVTLASFLLSLLNWQSELDRKGGNAA